MYPGVNPSVCFDIGKSITTAASTPQTPHAATNGATAPVEAPLVATAGAEAGASNTVVGHREPAKHHRFGVSVTRLILHGETTDGLSRNGEDIGNI